LEEFTQFLPVPVSAKKASGKKKEGKKQALPPIEPATTRTSNRKRKAASRADDRIRKQNDDDEPYLNNTNEGNFLIFFDCECACVSKIKKCLICLNQSNQELLPLIMKSS
jgi:hypothetical protein